MENRLEWHQQMYMYGLYISYFLFAIFFTNFIPIPSVYLDFLTLMMRYYMCIYLIVYFNPFDTHKSNNPMFDRRLIFSSAILLLLSSH